MGIDIYSERMEKEISNSSEQATDYDNIAQRYDIIEKSDVTLWHLGYQNLLSQIVPIVNKSILDYGCGSGTFCRFLRESKAIVTGVDTSENMINVAKKGYQDDIDYYHITSGNLDFLEADSFDIVILNFVLCTITTWHEIFKILNSIHRIIKTGGSINEPLSSGNEFPWIDEKLYPPYFIIEARKLMSTELLGTPFLQFKKTLPNV